MRTFRTVPELRVALAGAPRPVGFVPTMGALHEGHATLVRRCREECPTVVVSLFVNPLQFGPGEDLERYPRDLEADAGLLESLGTHVLFCPKTLYEEGFATRVDCGPVGERYEGAVRPGHFRGVCTVVTKLFNIVGPDLAYFGRKDAQQLAVIQQLVRDLDQKTTIVPVETVRDTDGLALSSRNACLSEQQRQSALGLIAGLLRARQAWQDGERDWGRLEQLAKDPRLDYDYLACVDPSRFEPPGPLLIAAVRLGPTRLIDNLLLDA